MGITIEHNGRELHFIEHDESWSCRSMNMYAKSLKALKAKLDKFDGQARRVNVPVMIVDTHFDGSIKRAEIVMIAKPRDWETDYSAKLPNHRGYGTKPSVWVSEIKGNETSRAKVALDRCLSPSPENIAAVEAARAKFSEAKRIRAEGEAIIAALPRLSIDDLTSRSVVTDDDA